MNLPNIAEPLKNPLCGIHLDRINDLDATQKAMITCDICENLVCEPVILVSQRACCAAHFPKDYLKNSQSESILRNIRAILDVIDVKCVYYTRGCMYVDKLKMLDNHEKNCDYQTEKCSCGFEGTKIDLCKHKKEKKCNLSKCPFCNFIVPKDDLANHITKCDVNNKLNKLNEIPQLILVEENKPEIFETDISVLKAKLKKIQNLPELYHELIQLSQERIEYLQYKIYEQNEEILRLQSKPKLQSPMRRPKGRPRTKPLEASKQIQEDTKLVQAKNPIFPKENNKCSICQTLVNENMEKCWSCGKLTCKACIGINEETKKNYCKKCNETCCITPGEVHNKIISKLNNNKPQDINIESNSVIYNFVDNKIYFFDLISHKQAYYDFDLTWTLAKVVSLKIGKFIYITGGKSSLCSPLVKTEKIIFDNEKAKYDSLKDMTYGRFHHCMVKIDENRFLCIGGYGKLPDTKKLYDLKDCEIYNIIENQWGMQTMRGKRQQVWNNDFIISLNESKVKSSACNFNNKFVYVFGTYNKNYAKKNEPKYLSTIERLDILQTVINWKWEVIKYKGLNVITQKIQYNCVQISENEILILTTLNQSFTYNTDKNEFTKEKKIEGNELLNKRMQTEIINFNGNIYFLINENPALLEYSIKDEKWQLSNNLTVIN